MSYVLDAASKVHAKQLDATAKIEQLSVRAARGLSDLRKKTPPLPVAISTPLTRVLAPVKSLIGTPGDFAAYTANSTRDWIGVQQSFQNAMIQALIPAPSSTATPAEPDAEQTT